MNAHKMTLSELRRISSARLTVLYPGDSIDRGAVQSDPAHQRHFALAEADTSVVTERRRVDMAELTREVESFARRLASRAPRLILGKLPTFAFVPTDQASGFVISRDRVQRVDIPTAEREPIRYWLASEVLLDSVKFDWGWSDLSIGARFQARVQRGLESREVWFWIIPMLAGEGYLKVWTLWFFKPRSLRVLWGRRLEVFDYLRSIVSGRFMSQVVRKKTDPLVVAASQDDRRQREGVA